MTTRVLQFGRLLLLLLAGFTADAAVIVNPWTPIFKGVEHATGEADAAESRIQKVNALRIDLWDSDIELFTTPSNGSEPLDTLSRETSEFLLTYAVQVAVNANFTCCVYASPANMDLYGLAISQGEIVSPPAPVGNTFAQALVVTRSNQASIVTATPSFNTTNIWTAIGGAEYVVKNGVNVGNIMDIHPRTCVGLSQNGRYIILLTIDGRQTGYSEGANHPEMGSWLLRFGAYVGFNLDGGGSTTMVKDNGLGGAAILNRPIHGGIPGNERYVGNHIGVYAPRVAPSIVTQPKSQTILAGQTAIFSVLAGGSSPLNLQWRFEGMPIAGATAPTLTITNAQLANAGSYSVVISNNLGSITSAPAVLNIGFVLTTLPGLGGTITKSPDQTIYPSNTLVTVTAVPDPGYTFTGWSGALTGMTNPSTIRMTGNQTIAASFSGSASDIILDNTNVVVTFNSGWSTGQSAAGRFGTNYRFALTTNAPSPALTATYRPMIYTPGQYAVYIWYPQGSNRSTNAPWTVSYNGGSITVPVNQQTNGGSWRFLTTQNFVRGTNGFVRLSNDASLIVVIADAVRFVYSPSPSFHSTSFSTNTGFHFMLKGGTSATYVVETSFDLLDWLALTNLPHQNGSYEFFETTTNLLHRFYRARSLP